MSLETGDERERQRPAGQRQTVRGLEARVPERSVTGWIADRVFAAPTIGGSGLGGRLRVVPPVKAPRQYRQPFEPDEQTDSFPRTETYSTPLLDLKI